MQVFYSLGASGTYVGTSPSTCTHLDNLNAMLDPTCGLWDLGGDSPNNRFFFYW